MMKKIGVWVLNIIGIIAIAWVIAKLAGSGGADTGGEGVSINLNGVGFIIWIVVLVVYFYGAKKLWGKTVGGLIMDKVMPAL